MSVWNVQNGQVFLDGCLETPEQERGKARVNEVMEKLADIVFKESPQVGFSAVVSFLALLLSSRQDPLSEVVNTNAVLDALVRINLTDEETTHIVYRT